MTVQVGLDTTYGYLSGTGIGRYVRSLTGALREIDEISVTELTATRRPGSRRSVRLAQGLRREAVWYPLLISRRAKTAGCNVLHVTHPTVAAAGRLPLVVSVHDIQPLVSPSLFTRWPRAQLRASIPVVRRAARVLAHSEASRQALIERLGLSPDRVVAAQLGLSASIHHTDSRETLTRLGLTGTYVLCVGALEPRKNLAAALRALYRVVDPGSELRIVVVGPRGWRNREFDSLAARSGGRVMLTGPLPDEDLSALYSHAACFVYPSLGEGFGLPALEAMACGAPVVTSNLTSLPEVVGDAGVLVDPRDEEELGEAIRKVLSDRAFAADLSRRGRERATLFTWERCAATTARVYREVAAV